MNFRMFVNSFVRYRMTVTSAKANTTHKDAVFKDNASIANKSFSHVNDNKNPAKQHVNTMPLYLLNGLDK